MYSLLKQKVPTMLRRRKTLTSVAIVLTASVLLVACGGDSPGAAKDEGGESVISVGHFPTSTTTLPLVVAQKKGFFAEEDLKVETVDAKGGPELTSALIGGTTQVAVGVPAAVIPAMSQGSPLVGLPPYPRLDLALAVPESSPITSLDGFAGKTVGVTQRGALTEKFASTVLQDAGIDPADVTFVAVGNLAAYVAALREGTIDAAVVTSDASVVLAAQEVPMRPIAGSLQGTAGDLSDHGLQSLYTTTNDFREENPEVLDAFCRSMGSAVEWIADEANQTEAGTIISEVMGIPPAAAEKIWEVQHEFWAMEITESTWSFNVDWTLDGSGDVPFESSQLADCG